MNFEEYKQKAFAEDPELYDEYKKLELEYAIVRQVIAARSEQKLTQKDLAEKIGIKQSNISRFESGKYNPSLDFLKKIADGLGKEIHIEFKEPQTNIKS